MRRQLSTLLAIAFLAVGCPCFAQAPAAPEPRRNAVFVELLGNGGLYSLNFERLLTDHLGLRVGFATWTSPLFFQGSPPDRYQTVPVTLSYLLGSGDRKLELGGGVTFGNATLDRSSDNPRDFSFRSVSAIVGYRAQPRDSGYLFRVGLTPFYSFDEGEEAYPDPGFFVSAGVSFGYRF